MQLTLKKQVIMAVDAIFLCSSLKHHVGLNYSSIDDTLNFLFKTMGISIRMTWTRMAKR
jgi:hypothetical protein